MKKVISLAAFYGFSLLSGASVFAQEAAEAGASDGSFHQILKEKFIEGGPEFMAVVLICLILGLAISIERIIYLNAATTNTKK